MSFEDYKRSAEAPDAVAARDRAGSRLPASTFPEAELQKYYEEHKADFVRKEQVFLSQILISTEGKTPEQVAAAEKKAKDLVARARKGEKFSDLVRENSDDPETARTAARCRRTSAASWPKNMEDVVFKEKKGYVTDPFKVAAGLRDPRSRRALRGRTGQLRRGRRRDPGDAWRSRRWSRKIREFLTRLRDGSVPGNQGRLRRQRRGSR